MSKVDCSITQRRLVKQKPDYNIEVWITGKCTGSGHVLFEVQVEGEDDPIIAAGIMERAIEVLRDE